MDLKLKVPWRRCDPLVVDFGCMRSRTRKSIMETIKERAEASPHVELEGRDAVVQNFFEQRNQVHDVSRYKIVIERCCVRHDNRHHINNDRYIRPHCDIPEQQLPQLPQLPRNIVLLLESPHKDEYQPGNINCPIAPANGRTGDGIDLYLATVLSHVAEQDLVVPNCHVIISNPIQFQTSLHAIHRQPVSKYKWNELKDNVWRTLWDQDHIKLCFEDRLRTYNPSLIINACTGDFGCGSNDPKGLVNAFIRDQRELQQLPHYEIYHPLYWATSIRKRGIHFRRIHPPADENNHPEIATTNGKHITDHNAGNP